jgi:hypothetical protein
MYTGCFWLAYQLTGNKFFKDCAEEHLKTYEERLEKNVGMDSHDVGFVFTPSCVAAYKLTGNEYARDLALRALDYFFEHSYSHEGKFIIRSWKGWAAGGGCRTMMDSLMNAPLLYWATEETGDEKYRAALVDSFMLSADNAHAVHPNHPELSDSACAPKLGGGVVVKYNANQKYTTDSVSDAVFRTLAERAGAKVQSYANRADMPGGSTLGSIANTCVSVKTVDIGLPQLAMHSATETAAVADVDGMIAILKEFYSSGILCEGEKIKIKN